MMIKFLARGTGSAAAAADYLTREQNLAPEQDQDQDQDRDPEKNPEEVKVLRGNPHQVADVADALQFEHKYTSGVIAWAPEDKPSDAQIGRVVAYSTSQKETRHEKILGHATDRPRDRARRFHRHRSHRDEGVRPRARSHWRAAGVG